jgi:recombination protein RecA
MPLESKKKKIERLLTKMSSAKANEGLNIGFGNVEDLKFLSTPFTTVNTLLRGGFPIGRFSVMAGPEMTGKSTFLLQCIAHQMQQDPEFIALWTDAETSLDRAWCTQLGIDLERLIIHRYSSKEEERYGEALLQQGLDIVSGGDIGIWVIDSVAALVPKAELDKTIVEGKMLDLQRKLSEFFRKGISIIDSNNTPCILIGQVYTVPDAHITFDEVKGGNAMKHWAHVRIRTRRGRRDLGPGEHEVTLPDGNKKKIVKGWPQVLKLDKTKINAREGEEVVLQFMHGRGFDSVNCAISALFAYEIFERRGAWYHHPDFPEDTKGDHKVQGKDSVVDLLTAHPGLLQKLTDNLDVNLAIASPDNTEQEAE